MCRSVCGSAPLVLGRRYHGELALWVNVVTIITFCSEFWDADSSLSASSHLYRNIYVGKHILHHAVPTDRSCELCVSIYAALHGMMRCVSLSLIYDCTHWTLSFGRCFQFPLTCCGWFSPDCWCLMGAHVFRFFFRTVFIPNAVACGIDLALFHWYYSFAPSCCHLSCRHFTTVSVWLNRFQVFYCRFRHFHFSIAVIAFSMCSLLHFRPLPWFDLHLRYHRVIYSNYMSQFYATWLCRRRNLYHNQQ